MIKHLISLLIFFIVTKEFISIILSFDPNLVDLYANELSISNLIIIAFLGIISYIPLSFYDFILKDRVNINLDNKKLYKFSWISSSIASIAGFGGSTAIALKSNFYGNHVKDKKLLIKEISKIVALNLTGFSGVSFIYTLTNFNSFNLSDWVSIMTILISIYMPSLLMYFVYKYLKGDENTKKNIKDASLIVGMSCIEWITTIILIFTITVMLNMKISFYEFFPVFMLSIIVAIVSMSPGGLGSFDLTMIVGLQAFNIPSEKVFVALFLYRCAYYILPLSIGILLYLHELWLRTDEDIKDIVTTILSKLAHVGIVLIVLFTGSVILLSESIPEIIDKIDIISNKSYLSVIYVPDGSAIIIGFLLIAMSRLLIYKSLNVYKATLAIIGVWTMITLLEGHHPKQAFYLILVGALVYIGKKQFYRKSFVMGWRMIIQDLIILLSFLVIYLYTFYASINGKISKIPLVNYEIKFSDKSSNVLFMSILGFAIAFLILCFIYYINSKNKFPKLILDDCSNDVENILSTYGGSSISHFVYLKDKYIYINEDKDVMIQYGIYANKIFVLGNPVGNPDNIFSAIQDFYKLCDMYAYIPTFCAIDGSIISCLHETGYQFFKLGEEARVNLKDFTLEGRKMKSVRNAISRVKKEGYSFEIAYPPFDDEFLANIKEVSDDWLCGRKEKGFSVGFYDKEYLNREPIAVVKDENNHIQGFANIMPMYDNDSTLSIDLMRFSKSSCNGIMDFMFVNLFEFGRDNGYSSFNMGMAPLSNVGRSEYAFISEKIASTVYSHGHRFYSFHGLKKFKEKYCESWDGRYMAYKRKTSLVGTMLQVILLVSKSTTKVK